MTLHFSRVPRWKTEPNGHRLVWRVLKWLISLLLLTWLLSRVDSKTVKIISSFPPTILGISLFIFASSQIFGALRLRVLLRSQGSYFSVLYIIRLTFSGFFINNFLPSTVGGDVYKAVSLTRQSQDLKFTVLVLLADRGVSLTVIALMTGAALPFTSFWNGWPMTTGYVSLKFLTISTGLIVAVVLCFTFLRSLKSAAQFIRSFSGRTASVIGRAFRLIAHPRVLAPAILFSCLSTGVSVLGQFVIARTLGMTLDVIQLAAVIGLVTLSALMPISINGLGIQEAGFISLLQLLDVPLEPAIAFAILGRVLIIGTSLVGGSILLFTGSSLKAT